MTAGDGQTFQAMYFWLAFFLAAGALAYNIFMNIRKTRMEHYTNIDRAYMELLSMAMREPYLRKPETIVLPEQKEKYDIYAFMVWNFLEAIYDKCLKDRELIETWGPIIEVEGALHIEWFKDISNKVKFKMSFYKYIEDFIESVIIYRQENNLHN